jgi:hypothetical protein
MDQGCSRRVSHDANNFTILNLRGQHRWNNQQDDSKEQQKSGSASRAFSDCFGHTVTWSTLHLKGVQVLLKKIGLPGPIKISTERGHGV